jgi:hypothetical protein
MTLCTKIHLDSFLWSESKYLSDCEKIHDASVNIKLFMRMVLSTKRSWWLSVLWKESRWLSVFEKVHDDSLLCEKKIKIFLWLWKDSRRLSDCKILIKICVGIVKLGLYVLWIASSWLFFCEKNQGGSLSVKRFMMTQSMKRFTFTHCLEKESAC